MNDTKDRLLRRLPTLLLVVLIATYLIRISLIAASADTTSPDSSRYTYPYDNFKLLVSNVTSGVQHASRRTATDINSGVSAVARAPGNVAHFASSVADVPAFITPASKEQTPVPVIIPVPAAPMTTVAAASPPPVATQPAAATPPAPAVAPPVVPPAPIETAAAVVPAPQTDNLYAWGNCTWWAAGRRAQVGRPIPNSWGNASSWAIRAIADGYAVDHRPTPGAIMQTPYMAGGLGHVAFVESVAPDGSWRISEMNVLGLDRVDYAVESPAAAYDYNFIH